jgi:hypothetical protein
MESPDEGTTTLHTSNKEVQISEDIKIYIKCIRYVGAQWMQLAQDMICCHVVNIVIKLTVPWKETDIVAVQDVRKGTHNWTGFVGTSAINMPRSLYGRCSYAKKCSSNKAGREMKVK